MGGQRGGKEGAQEVFQQSTRQKARHTPPHNRAMKDVPKVYFTNLRTNPNRSLIDKTEEAFNRTGFGEKYGKGVIIAIKLPSGEAGNASFIRPVFVRRIADRFKESVRGV